MRIERKWAMPNKWTFTIKPIKKLIEYYMSDTHPWVDPFAGMHSPAHIRNDINPNRNAEYNLDANVFLKTLPDDFAAGVLFDPPFSFHQLSTTYSDTITSIDPISRTYRSETKREIYRVLKPNGYVISFGWNTNGCAQGKGHLEKIHVLIIPHGSSRNDTLCTVEQKIQHTL